MAFSWNETTMDETAASFSQVGNAMIQDIEDLGVTLINQLAEWQDEGATAYQAVKKQWQDSGTEISAFLAGRMADTLRSINTDLTGATMAVARTYS